MSTASSLRSHEAAARPGRSVFKLIRATAGSSELYNNSTSHAVLTPKMGIQTLPTGIFRSLHAETWGLRLGQSSSILKGLQIYPGVIDNDGRGRN